MIYFKNTINDQNSNCVNKIKIIDLWSHCNYDKLTTSFNDNFLGPQEYIKRINLFLYIYISWSSSRKVYCSIFVSFKGLFVIFLSFQISLILIEFEYSNHQIWDKSILTLNFKFSFIHRWSIKYKKLLSICVAISIINYYSCLFTIFMIVCYIC